jgi:hypothetical protein
MSPSTKPIHWTNRGDQLVPNTAPGKEDEFMGQLGSFATTRVESLKHLINEKENFLRLLKTG